MKNLFKNLTFWVLTAIICGILLGHYAPDWALKQVLTDDLKATFMGQELKLGKTISEFLSGLFISTVKLFINPIIFLTITLGIVQMGDLKKVGKLGAKALLYFEVVTTVALLIGVVVANIIRPGDGVNASGVKGDISKYTKSAADFSWLKFLQDNSTLQVLIAAILFGVIMSKYSGRQAIMDKLSVASKYLFKGLHKVMLFAPIGAFGGMAFTIGKYGIATLLPLAKLMATVYTTMAIFVCVILWGILRMYKIDLFKFLRSLFSAHQVRKLLCPI
jgi:aerobic C4-dicarboxylate transport protein